MSEKGLIQLINDFIDNHNIKIPGSNGDIINPIEIYYKAHTLCEVLVIFEKQAHTEVMREKLLKIAEDVLEYDK